MRWIAAVTATGSRSSSSSTIVTGEAMFRKLSVKASKQHNQRTIQLLLCSPARAALGEGAPGSPPSVCEVAEEPRGELAIVVFLELFTVVEQSMLNCACMCKCTTSVCLKKHGTALICSHSMHSVTSTAYDACLSLCVNITLFLTQGTRIRTSNYTVDTPASRGQVNLLFSLDCLFYLLVGLFLDGVSMS
jgi:hypothetical protein